MTGKKKPKFSTTRNVVENLGFACQTVAILYINLRKHNTINSPCKRTLTAKSRTVMNITKAINHTITMKINGRIRLLQR